MPMHVELVSPERVLLSTEAIMVHGPHASAAVTSPSCPATPRSSAALATWIVEIIADRRHRGSWPRCTVGSSRSPTTSVKILSDLAELADGIDVDRAQAALERAEAVVARGDDEVAMAEAIDAVARANARLRAAGALV